MAVYNSNGDVVLTCFDSSGNTLGVVYDSVGNIISDEGSPLLKVATYNVGQFYSGNSNPIPTASKSAYSALQTSIFNNIKPDICLMQEATRLFCEDGTLSETFLSSWFDEFHLTRGDIGYQAHMIASKDMSVDDYTEHSFTDAVGNYPGYETGYITFNDKRIFICNTHISTSQSYQEAQCAEMLQLVADKESFILCGDFNTVIFDKTEEDWVNCIKPFADAGYNLANCGSFGIMPTYWATSSPNPSDGYTPATDFIITSSDISILYASTDKTKLTDGLNDKIDHVPLFAVLSV